MSRPHKSPTKGPTIGMGILSWHGEEALNYALKSYEKENIFSLFDERVIFLPEADDAVRKVAQKYPLRIEESEDNLGIFGGMEKLARLLSTDYILFLENDCPIIESNAEAKRQINYGAKLLEAEAAAVIRLRNVKMPGKPFVALNKYERYYGFGLLPILRRIARPGKARRLIGTAIYCENQPAHRHPKYIKLVGDDFYLVDSHVMGWSNLCVMTKRKYFLDVLAPYVKARKTKRRVNGFKNMEIELNRSPLWLNSGWKIACGPGLFTHKQIGYRGY